MGTYRQTTLTATKRMPFYYRCAVRLVQEID